MVEFLLSLFVMFVAPELAAKIPAPRPAESPAPIERAAETPPVAAPRAEMPRVTPAD